jgi:hypothetical protein
MSDVDHSCAITDSAASTKPFLSSLNDELTLALQEAKLSAAKRHSPLPPSRNHASDPEAQPQHAAHQAVTNSKPVVTSLPPAAPSRTTRQTDNIITPAPKAAETQRLPDVLRAANPSPSTTVSRSIVDSAVSLLRTGIQGIQTIAENRLRSNDTVRPEVLKESAPRAMASVDIVPASLPNIRRGEPDKPAVVATGLQDVRIDYARSTPQQPLAATLLSRLEPQMQTQMQTQTQKPVETAVNTPPPSTNEQSRLPSNLVAQLPRMPVDSYIAAKTIAQTQAQIQTQTQMRADSGTTAAQPIDKTLAFRPSSDYPGRMITNDPINVRINVRSFSVDGQAKMTLPRTTVPAILPTTIPIVRTTIIPTTMPAAIIPTTRMPIPGVMYDDESDAAEQPVFNPAHFNNSEKRYTLGAEIALAAITAAAGTSRRRADLDAAKRKRLNLDDESAVSEPAYVITPRQRPTMLIGGHDTLVDIAERRFDDPNLGWLIADLNKDVSNQVKLDGKYLVEFESRQEIVLPVWDDIVEFYQANRGSFNNSLLITIVKQNVVDQELLEATLGPIMRS